MNVDWNNRKYRFYRPRACLIVTHRMHKRSQTELSEFSTPNDLRKIHMYSASKRVSGDTCRVVFGKTFPWFAMCISSYNEQRVHSVQQSQKENLYSLLTPIRVDSWFFEFRQETTVKKTKMWLKVQQIAWNHFLATVASLVPWSVYEVIFILCRNGHTAPLDNLERQSRFVCWPRTGIPQLRRRSGGGILRFFEFWRRRLECWRKRRKDGRCWRIITAWKHHWRGRKCSRTFWQCHWTCFWKLSASVGLLQPGSASLGWQCIDIGECSLCATTCRSSPGFSCRQSTTHKHRLFVSSVDTYEPFIWDASAKASSEYARRSRVFVDQPFHSDQRCFVILVGILFCEFSHSP